MAHASAQPPATTVAGRVLFAHGFGQTRTHGTPPRALSAAGLQTLAYDARGHGDSDWNAELPYHGEQFR
jgi:alpha-beta hydrolase superfamily lysophospholipase